MKQYKVIVNHLPNFKQGDILIEWIAYSAYRKINTYYGSEYLESDYVERHPEYFKQLKENEMHQPDDINFKYINGMEKYKVLTNLFRDFDEGDIIKKWYYADNTDCYVFKNRRCLDLTQKLPTEFVENYPEYFKEIGEINELPTMNKIRKILRTAKDVEYWSLNRYEEKNVIINVILK